MTGLLENRHVGWPFIWLSFFYLANFAPLFGIPAQYAALWSLAVEEHFYLIWPTVVRSVSRRAAARCAAGVFIICPIFPAIAYQLGYNYGGYTWLVADALGIGALLGILIRGRLSKRSPMRQFSLACIFAAIALLGFGTPLGVWRGTTLFGAAFRYTAVNLFYVGFLGLALLLGTSRFQWIVRRPALQWFGEISYGLYLIHMLAFDFIDHWIVRYSPRLYSQISSHFWLIVLRFMLSMAVAVVAAFLSRKYFEEAFLKLKDRLTTPAAAMRPTPGTVEVARKPVRQTA